MKPNFRRKRQDIEATFVINNRKINFKRKGLIFLILNLSHKTVNLILHGYYLTWYEFLLHETVKEIVLVGEQKIKKGSRSVLWQTECTLAALIFTLTA